MWGQILKDDRFARYTAPAGGSLNTSVLVRSAEALADDLGAIDDRDKGTRIDFARIAACTASRRLSTLMITVTHLPEKAP